MFLGALELAITAEEEILPPEGEGYREFLSTAEGAPERPTIRVRLSVTEAPRAEGRVVFESGAHWSLLKDGGRRTFVDRQASRPVLAAHFEPGGTEVSVECSPDWVSDGGAIHCPVHYPLDQVLAMYLLGRQGLVVHAAGVRVRGRAVVLPGVSGAGKTTFCRLGRDREGWDGLSDDRVILHVDDAAMGAVAHGTPWPGEGGVAEKRSGPVEGLVFLAQGPENLLEPLAPGAALRRLLATTSIPWYDPGPLGLALEACERLVTRVPAALLTFRPDPAAADLVEGLARGTLPRPREP